MGGKDVVHTHGTLAIGLGRYVDVGFLDEHSAGFSVFS